LITTTAIITGIQTATAPTSVSVSVGATTTATSTTIVTIPASATTEAILKEEGMLALTKRKRKGNTRKCPDIKRMP
jgi:hypothetical protein